MLCPAVSRRLQKLAEQADVLVAVIKLLRKLHTKSTKQH